MAPVNKTSAADKAEAPPPGLTPAFVARTLFVIAAVGFAWLLVQLTTVWLLAFGAVVAAVVLRALADPLARRLPLGDGAALAVAVVILAAGLGGVFWLFGAQMAEQIALLIDRLPAALDRVEQQIAQVPNAEALRDLASLGDQADRALALAPSFARGLLGALTNLVLVLVAGIMLAAQPARARDGLVRLFPKTARPRANEVLNATGEALNQWLLGQFISMVIIGLLTGVGLWLVGVPSAIALGLVAGVAQFVPIVGPIASAVPGLLIAASSGPHVFVLALAVYVGVQQVESNLITPVVQRRTSSLPMVLTVFAVVGFGLLLGPLGVVLATPLAVVIFTLVRMVYIQDVLGDPLADEPSERGGLLPNWLKALARRG